MPIQRKTVRKTQRPTKPKFVYKKRSGEVLRKRQEASGDFDSFVKSNYSMFSPKAGEHLIRLMPPTFDYESNPGLENYWGIDVFVHYGIGADNASYLCPRKMKIGPCPICEERTRASAEDADADEDYLRDLRANRRVLAWVIDRDNEKDGPLLWSIAKTLDDDISLRCKDKGTGEILAIDNPDEGYDVEFVREGEKLRTRYTGVNVARTPSPLSEDEDQQEAWLQYIQENPLTEVLQVKSYTYLQEAFSGKISKGKDDTEEYEEVEQEEPEGTEVEEEYEDEPTGEAEEEEPWPDEEQEEIEEEPEPEPEPAPRARTRHTKPRTTKPTAAAEAGSRLEQLRNRNRNR